MNELAENAAADDSFELTKDSDTIASAVSRL